MEIWRNNNTLSKYKESLPLEDRDDYADWKIDYDYMNTSAYKRDKFRHQLDTKRNKSGVEKAWLTFGQRILDMSKNNIDSSIGTYKSKSEYDDEFFVINILNYPYGDVDNSSLLMYAKDRQRYYGKTLYKVIEDMMVSKKVDISLVFDLTCESLIERRYPYGENGIDLYIKDAIGNGYSRKDVSKTKKFLTNFYEEIEPFINSIEKDLNMLNIAKPIFTGDIGNAIAFSISLEIPYNFGVKDNNEEEMTNKAELLADNLEEIYEYISPLLLNK